MNRRKMQLDICRALLNPQKKLFGVRTDNVDAIRKELAKGKKKKDVALKFGMSVYGLSYVIRKYIPERRIKKAPDTAISEAAAETA